MSSPYALVDERTKFHLPAVIRGQRIMQKKKHFPVSYGLQKAIFIGKYTGSIQVKMYIQIIMGN